MNLQLIISSEYPSIINISNKSYIYDNGEKIHLKISFDANFFITCSEIDTQNTITNKFTYNSGILTSQKNVMIVKHTTNIFELIFRHTSNIQQILNHPTKNALLILNGNQLKIIEKSKVSKNILLHNQYPHATISNINDISIIKSKTTKGHNICLIDKNFNISEYKNSYLKLTDNEIKIASPYNDYLKHTKVTHLDANTLAKKESYMARKKSTQIYTNENVIPFAFLQCILAKDYKEALNYLDDSLKSSLKKEHIRLFFGDFVQIATPKDDAKKSVTLIYHEKDNIYSTKTFRFEIQNSKITNIN